MSEKESNQPARTKQNTNLPNGKQAVFWWQTWKICHRHPSCLHMQTLILLKTGKLALGVQYCSSWGDEASCGHRELSSLMRAASFVVCKLSKHLCYPS